MNKEPIRILHVVGGIGAGGIQSYLINLYRNIDKSKIQFDFLVHIRSDKFYEKEILALGGRIYYIENDYFERKKWFKYKKYIKKFFKEHNEYKIVHGHLRSTSYVYLSIAKKYHMKTICHSHSTTNGYGISARLKNFFQFPSRFVTDYYMGCSQKANEWMFGKRRANSHNCFVVNNGIDESKFKYDKIKREEVRDKLKISNDTLIIGNVGRLTEVKNHMLLLHIFKEISQINNDTILMIVGNGPLMNNLIKEAKNLNIYDKIIFTGSRFDVPDLMQAFDIFALTSKNEGLGIVAIEAQASGLITVVSQAIPEEAYITDLCVRCDSDNPNNWCKLIMDLSKNINRKDTSNLIIQKNYSIKTISKWLSEFYLSILK